MQDSEIIESVKLYFDDFIAFRNAMFEIYPKGCTEEKNIIKMFEIFQHWKNTGF